MPRFHMLSQVAAAAVTEDVSFTAVPAKIPKASPDKVSKPSALPRIGNIIAASTLKKKITDNGLRDLFIVLHLSQVQWLR